MRRLLFTAMLLGLGWVCLTAGSPFPPGVFNIDRSHTLLQKAEVWLPVLPTHMGGTTWWNLIGTTHGVLTNGAVWTYRAATRFGGNVLLDGINDYVDLGDTSAVTFERTERLTMAISLNITTLQAAALISKANPGAPYEGIWFEVRGDGTVYCGLWTPADNIQLKTTAALTADAWHTVVCVYNGGSTEDSLLLYFDGVSQATVHDGDNLSISGSLLTSEPLRLGARADGTFPLAAEVSNVIICRCAWRDSQIQAYKSLDAPWYGGMLRHTPFEGATLVPAAPKRKVVIQ